MSLSLKNQQKTCDLDHLAELDYICNNPTEDEIRFNCDCDIISSTDSEVEDDTASSKLIKYNQLLPRGKIIQKLLHLTKPNLNQSWRVIRSAVNFYQGQQEQNIGLESNLEIITPRTMNKSHKRKREYSDGDEEESSCFKKSKSDENKLKSKKVKRKEKSHNVSSSDSESTDTYAKKPSKSSGFSKNVNKPTRNELNTHLLSSESDNEANVSFDFTSNNMNEIETVNENGGFSSNDHESVENSEDETDHRKNSFVESASVLESNKKKIYKTPRFTDELNEEISKYSLLLDENLVEDNEIWILQCPTNMDCSALVNQKLSLGGSSQLSDGERTYEAYSYQNKHARSATLAVPSQRNRLQLRRIPISGSIIVEESVQADGNLRCNEIISESPSRVEFPDNLRVRHPLLGIDFSKQPRTVKRTDETATKKKRHPKKHDESFNGLVQESSCFSLPKKKKKKDKDRNSEDVSMTDYTEQTLDESVGDSAVKKKKKKKHKDNDSFN